MSETAQDLARDLAKQVAILLNPLAAQHRNTEMPVFAALAIPELVAYLCRRFPDVAPEFLAELAKENCDVTDNGFGIGFPKIAASILEYDPARADTQRPASA